MKATSLLTIIASFTLCLASACDSDEAGSAPDLFDANPPDATLPDAFAPASQATTVAGITYGCQIDVGAAWTDCNPLLVDAGEVDPGEWSAKVIMGNPEADFRRMDIFAEVCDPTDYAFSVADSPTANGWGGDSGTTDHDAEGHLYGPSLHFFSTTDFLHGAFGNNTTVANAHAGGCQITHTVVYHAVGSNVSVFGYEGGGSPLTLRDTRGFKLNYNKCPGGASDPSRGVTCDYEDAARTDEGFWYFGLNRTVGNGARDGTGVKQACVVLNEDVTVVPANCLESAPPIHYGEPEGTRKMCISGGTQAEMLAECEQNAQANVTMYTGGTWDTQDYISHWTDPCPAGTSIVSDSQYYVANSCSPLPHVGIDCYGAGTGSYNWEFKLGVQCQ